MIKFIKDWVIPALIALAIVLLINQFLFQLVTVPTGSMIATIMPKDKLFVNRLYNTDNAKRGDVVVFKSEELNEKLVKRLIGLPGDTVEIKSSGEVYINGEKLDEPYAAPNSGCANQIFEVPEDCYFFLGDNRQNSYDARKWENPYINKKYVIGKAEFVFFPFSRIGKIE